MPATTFPSSPRPDHTFRIAVIAAAVLGAAELIAVGVHYAGRARAARKTSEAPVVASQQHAAATPALEVAVAPTAAPVATPAVPTSVAQTTPSNAALSMAEQFLKEATLLRERGDTTNAIARLQEASQRDPQNANVLAELAMIYESIQLFDRSNETWRKIQAIGPSAGALYELADMKLKVGAVPVAPSSAATGPGFAGVSPLDAGTNRTTADGIPDGSSFGITEATVAENPDPDAEANLTLKVGVKVKANTIIDHTKVKIQVYFYDSVDDGQVPALTDAEVNYEWLTPNHDWKTTNTELLAVSYVRLKGGVLSDTALAEAAANVTPPTGGRKGNTTKKAGGKGGSRKYAGYQIRVYYNEQLQDVRAEPTKLLNFFPPPLSLQSQ